VKSKGLLQRQQMEQQTQHRESNPMGKLQDVMAAELKSAGQQPLSTFDGLSSGLNARSHVDRGRAILSVLPDSVLVGFMKPSLPMAKAVVERFSPSDIMEVREGDEPITGVAGAMARKNASNALGRAFGASSTTPAVTLVTRRGDLVFAFKQKERGLARQAYVLITEAMSQ
jgi:hypothetical protein